MRITRPRVRPRALLLLTAVLVPSLAARAPEHPRRAGTTIVVGRVSDPAGQPLGGVVVAIAERSLSASTGADGRYVLRVARQGDIERVVVTFRRIGYSRLDLPLAVRGDTLRLDAQLVPAATTLESTVITGAPTTHDGVLHDQARRATPQGRELMRRDATAPPRVAVRGGITDRKSVV